MKKQKCAGWLFIVFAVLVQIPFAMLSASYGYPDILRKTPGHVLTEFYAGGSRLIWTWYFYAMSILVFTAAVLCYESARKISILSRAIRAIGLISGVLQMVALLRWVFIVPLLAELHHGATREAQETIELIFKIQHGFLGVGIGEHIGQILMLLWTILMAIDLRDQSRGFILTAVCASALLFMGLSEHLAVVLNFDPGIFAHAATTGFLLWLVWLIWLGVKLLRANR